MQNKTDKHPSTYISRFWSIYFTIAAEFGNETFFIIALPWLYWNAPNDLARAVVLLWGLAYYLGQWIKDYLQLPRPPSPPVIQLESWYEAEYGLPSTHAMGAICIPGYISLYCIAYDYWTVPIGILFFVLYSLSVIGSRLYLGVHSPADLFTGTVLAIGILLGMVWKGALFDEWLMVNWCAPLIVPLVCVVLLLIYPRVPKWTNAYGDT